jgi:hypothetical protein
MSNLTITTGVEADPSAGTLNVKDHGHAISVPREKDQTTLVWTLTGAGSNAAFNTIDLSDPDNSGFSWVGWPNGTSPPGFKTPYLSADNNQIRMIDKNDGSATAGGPYMYTLRALVNGTPCSTTSSVSPPATVNNPKIKNE